jgi:trehalose 2-sulfotransferase
MAQNSIKSIFTSPNVDTTKYERLKAVEDPAVRYIIAMTPRSGSSHLCDVIKTGKLLGRPGEMLSRDFIPNILKNVPGHTPDEYLSHVFRALRSSTGISGIKCSWFQFKDFRAAMTAPDVVDNMRYIYLTRRDLTAQAVSLYRATQTKVFHTNVEHSAESLAKLDELPYDYEQIKFWRTHIKTQETGWQRFFVEKNIFPLYIQYEDIDANVAAVAQRIAAYIGRPRAAREVQPEASIFRKISSRKSVEWTARFDLEYDAELRAQQAAQAEVPISSGAPHTPN